MNLKANASDTSRSISDITLLLETKLSSDDLHHHLSDKISKSELQFLLNAKPSTDDIKLLLDDKVNTKEFVNEMNTLTQKVETFIKDTNKKLSTYATVNDITQLKTQIDTKAN